MTTQTKAYLVNMKQCSSLTSLRQGGGGGDSGPDHHQNTPANSINIRPYNSLTKRPKRRLTLLDSPTLQSDPRQYQEGSDDFWAAIQPDYNYLMGRQLIDSCCQELLSHNSQQAQLTENLRDLSTQPTQPRTVESSGPISVEKELASIKSWLDEAEVRLGPEVTECRGSNRWGPPGVPATLNRDAKIIEHMKLHCEIEKRGRVLSALQRICKTPVESSKNPTEDFPPHRRARSLKLAERLQKRWQILYLKNLEWILHLESKPDKENLSESSDSLSDDSGATPARKKRMLTAPLIVTPFITPEMSPEGDNDSASLLEPMDLEAQMYAAFNRSGRSKVANSAVFYYKHSTTDQSSNSTDNDEEEWTYTDNNKGARSRLNFGEDKNDETSEPPSSPSPSPQNFSSPSSSEDLHTSVATCIGQSPDKVVLRPKRSPQRVKRRPVSLPFSLMSPESPVATPTSKTCSETNLATLSRKKRTIRRSKRRLQQTSHSSESEDLMCRLAMLNHVSGIIKSSSFSGTCNVTPAFIPDGSHSEPSCRPRSNRRRKSGLVISVPPIRVTEESGEPSWDSYQERYNSEAYSEDIIDSETARKLLEFGDDYSNFLPGEFSDSSARGPAKTSSSSGRRRRDSKLPPLAPDSDSEVEELRYVLRLSQESLAYTSQRLVKANDKFNSLVEDMGTLGPDNIINVGELAEMAATCRESKKCVALVISRIEQDAAGIADLQLIHELYEHWDDLESKTQELQRSSMLARQVTALRQSLLGVTSRQAELCKSRTSRTECRLALQMKLAAVKEQMAMMSAIKSQLCDTNMLIHRLSTEDNATYRQKIKSTLKVQISELYELWELTNDGLEGELGRTEEQLRAWEELDKQLCSLRGSLLRDRQLLLSTKSKEISDCGSLSDSGISDAGSEVLEVREKELTSLRELANQLPLQTRQDIVQELDAAERELVQLRLYSSQRNLSMSCGPSEVPPPVPRGPRQWLKYVPVCLVTILAIVCTLLQPPNCCEYLNTGPGSHWEQLRFQHGPPPV